MSTARVVLPPVASAARSARTLVSEACSAAHASAFQDTAVLLTSELVTNALLHAHSDVEVVVDTCPRGLRVEVRDRDERLPERRTYDTDASTGRGGVLVDALADDHGAKALGAGGKVVWFSLGDPPPWQQEPASSVPRPVLADPVRVVLRGLPVGLFHRWQQQADGLLREAFLSGCDTQAGTRPVVEQEEHSRAQRGLALLVGAVDRALQAAPARERTDVALDVPPDDVLLVGVLRGALGKATAAAGAGLLLCAPTRPELNALRDWLCDEVCRQATGLPPQRWRQPTAIDPRGSGVRAACLAARASGAAELLADEHGVLVAVSSPANQLLGWPEGHLEGAPVTALVPERLVEAHLAGFQRLLMTGTGRILDRPTPLRARRRDGSETSVVLTVSQRTEPDGRLFHALLETPPASPVTRRRR